MSNKILLRFASEATFDKFVFSSESVTGQEILDFLARKKKIGSVGKTDHVSLFNIDENKEVSHDDKDIQAGSRLIVTRRPPENSIKQQTQNVSGVLTDIMEVSYNPDKVRKHRIERQLNL
jgi:hypothetical protein